MPISVLVLVFSAAAAADAVGAGQKPRADLNVTEILSLDLRGDTSRAIKGYDEIYPFLVLERIRPPATEGDPPRLINVWKLSEMTGGGSFDRALEGDEISGMKWRGEALEFVRTVQSRKQSCRISRITEAKPFVSCQPAKR